MIRTCSRFALRASTILAVASHLSLAAIAAAPAYASELVVSQSADVLTLDPVLNNSSLATNVYFNVFDQLTIINSDSSIGPRIAESWEVNDDATEWTFKIREGMTFHDGSKVTADDVIGTYQIILDNPKSPNRAYLNTVKSMEKIDEHTVKITLAAPFAIFDRQTSLISIIPVKHYQSVGSDGFSAAPIGSGPFKVSEWVKDGHIQLEAFQDYWKGPATVDRVQVRVVPSEPARAAGIASGEIDIVPLLPPPLVASLSNIPDMKVEKIDSNRTVYLGYNTQVEGPLADLRIRKAIDHAIDRKMIAESLLQGLGIPSGQIAAPVLFGHDPNTLPTEFNPEEAKRLLAEAGYDGQPIEFLYPNNRWAFAEQTAQAIAGYLTKAGIKVEMKPMEFSAFFPLWLGNKLTGMYMFSLGLTTMDSDVILNLEYESGTGHGYTFTDEIDALGKAQRAMTDPEERKAALAKIWKISQDTVMFSPLYTEVQAYGIRDCVDWKPRHDERLYFHEATSTCSH